MGAKRGVTGFVVAAVVVAAVTITGMAPARALDPPVLDQQNDPVGPNGATGEAYCEGDFGLSLFQSVRPPVAPDRLARVTLRLVASATPVPRDVDNRINIRTGGVRGPVIATSSVRLPGVPPSTQVLVDFPIDPPLTFAPGQDMVIEWVATRVNQWGWTTSAELVDPYPAGQAWTCGGNLAPPGRDWNFATYRVPPAPGPVLVVATSVNPTTTGVGQEVEQIVKVFNVGDAASSGSYSLGLPWAPAEYVHTAQAPPGGTCNVVAAVLHTFCSGGPIEAGGVRTFRLSLAVARAGSTVLLAKLGGATAAAVLQVEPIAGDADGDALLDAWEVPGGGPDGDGDGIADFVPYDYGARADHKDVFLELDWLRCASPDCGGDRSWRPDDSAIAGLVSTFSRGSTTNPDGLIGVNLHVTVDPSGTSRPTPLRWASDPTDGPSITDTTVDAVTDVKDGAEATADLCDGAFGSVEDRSAPRCAAILAAKQQVFHWALFGPADDVVGGIAEIVGDDLLIDIDDFAGFPAGYLAPDASSLQQVLVTHEFGHNLGLQHGGDESVPVCKPNYQSVMNASYTYGIYTEGRVLLDYSHERLRDINEASLPDDYPLDGRRVDPFPVVHFANRTKVTPLRAANDFQDWDGDGVVEHDTLVSADVDNSGTEFCLSAGTAEQLHGYNDWLNLVFAFKAGGLGTGGAPSPLIEEPTLAALAEPIGLRLAEVDVQVDPVVLGGGQEVPVVLRTTPSFDTATVDPATACFGDADHPGERSCALVGAATRSDIDGDGDGDLVLRFAADQTGLDEGGQLACVSASTLTGEPVSGCDRVRVVRQPPSPTCALAAWFPPPLRAVIAGLLCGR